MLNQLEQYIQYISPIVGPLLLLAFFGLAFKRRNSLLDMERGMTPIHKESCGGRFNHSNFSKPFVRLALYNDFMVISYFKQILLHYHEIEKVELKRQFGKKYLRIFHKKIDAPKKILLLTKNADQIANIINSKLQNYPH